jgi:hypothetical protein
VNRQRCVPRPRPVIVATLVEVTRALAEEVKENVLLAPDPVTVKPVTVGNAYVDAPDSASVAAAVTVKLPVVAGRKYTVLPEAEAFENPVKRRLGTAGGVVSTRASPEAAEGLDALPRTSEVV